jgi:hypothetical protein
MSTTTEIEGTITHSIRINYQLIHTLL